MTDEVTYEVTAMTEWQREMLAARDSSEQAIRNSELIFGKAQQAPQCSERLVRPNGNRDECSLTSGHPGVHQYAPSGVQLLPPLPPHGSYPSLNARAQVGDDIVITGGEQKGWRGRVTDVDATTISAKMTKPDGSTANGGMPTKHRASFVAKVLTTPPPFDTVEDAEAWLTAQDREVRPAYVTGEMVRFERQVRIKKRGTKPVQKRVLTGKVIGFKADAHVEASPTGRGPSYRVLTFDLPMTEGGPAILWVEPASIVTQ